jgi:hypothetical protein
MVSAISFAQESCDDRYGQSTTEFNPRGSFAA